MVSDVDNNFIHAAKIQISENFKSGDRLSIGFNISERIIPTFNATIGELVLTGKDTKSNYEAALTQVAFFSPVAAEADDKKISITVNDSTSNSNVASRIVHITEVFPELKIVNSFTPNNDGVNDVWEFDGTLATYTKINIAIFDRDGVKVFGCTDKNCVWDGRHNGKELPAGSYLYSIELNNGKRRYQGTVTILK